MHKLSCTILILILIFGFAAIPGRAQTLYRCLSGQAAVSYQAQPCSGGQRLDRIVAYQRDPPSRPVTGLSKRIRRTDTRYATYRAIRRAAPHQPTASERCRQGKRQRAAQLQRLGLARSYADLSRLDAEVRAVCNGY